MGEYYNPIVRTFNRLRAELMTLLGKARPEIRTTTRLDALIPAEQRRNVWTRLRRRGFKMPHTASVDTVGQLAVHATAYTAHRASGYRWSKGDIALKVRIIVADNLDCPLEAIQRETDFINDLSL